jgi:5'-nucleotidase
MLAAGCGDRDRAVPRSGERGTTTTTAAEGGVLQILVTNDDGVGAAGIDALVRALTAVEGVEVMVVAPSTEQTGTGGRVTEGTVAHAPARTAGGHEATAVDGFPADSVRVAFDDLGLAPDLVVSGINEGQNLGPVVDLSGTVGAARAAARRGVPALAVSSGIVAAPAAPDYAAAADLVVTWLGDNRDAIVAHEMPVDAVHNLNVPTCTAGELRGTLEVESATAGNPLGPSDCTDTADGFTDDVSAFTAGFAALTVVPLEPATAPAEAPAA